VNMSGQVQTSSWGTLTRRTSLGVGCGVPVCTCGARGAGLCVLGCGFVAKGESGATFRSVHQTRESTLGCPAFPSPEGAYVMFVKLERFYAQVPAFWQEILAQIA
jgi:hypothetical protein